MSWVPIVGKGMTLSELQDFVDQLPFTRWRPQFLVLHNTGAPTLAQWKKTAEQDKANGQVPGSTRIRNLERYFRDERGWPSAPHAFVADDLVWPFTPFNVPGTHSPSWNGVSIGIEMVGDFASEADNVGPGLKVIQNTVALFGMLHMKLGLNPDTIKLHKEDKRTTHDCPGKNVVKSEFIAMVKDWMNHAGDFDRAPPENVTPPPRRTGTVNVSKNDYLNLRESSSASSPVKTRMLPGQVVTILGMEKNRDTLWYRVDANGVVGWAAARYITM